VNPGSYGFLGGIGALQIQGFDRDRVLILEDGERVVGDVGGAIDLSAIPTADLDRIEIVQGPTSSLYGSAALGGVVNIITAPPRDFGPSGRARLEYRSLNGVVAQGSGGYKFRSAYEPWIGLDLNYTRIDGVKKQPDLPDLRLPENERSMIGLRGGARLTREMDVRIRMRAFHDRFDGIETRQPPGLPRFVVDDPEATNRYTLHLIHVTKLDTKGSSLRLTLGRQQYDNFTASQFRGSPVLDRHDRTERMQSFEGVATFADGPRTWVTGARFEAEHFDQRITSVSSTATGLVTTSGQEVVPLGYGTSALYGQLGWKLGGGVTVMPGVRFEEHTKYGESVAPRLAAAWVASPIVTVRASGGRGFRAPSAKELGFVFDHSIYGYKILGNADLAPEKSWGINADVTVTPDKRMSLRGSAYMNWVQDLIDIDLGNGHFDNGIATYTYANFGRARTAGAEAGAVFQPAPFLRAESSYAYTWTRDDVNDQPLPGRPPHSVTVSLRVEPGWKMELYARARIVTNSFLSSDDKGETRAPGYENFDVRVARELWAKSQLYVGALNLTDVKQDPGRVGDTRSPLGRILYVGLKADFPWEDE
jgi:outer membrane receptor for ferrienterochelin and colicins